MAGMAQASTPGGAARHELSRRSPLRSHERPRPTSVTRKLGGGQLRALHSALRVAGRGHARTRTIMRASRGPVGRITWAGPGAMPGPESAVAVDQLALAAKSLV